MKNLICILFLLLTNSQNVLAYNYFDERDGETQKQMLTEFRDLVARSEESEKLYLATTNLFIVSVACTWGGAATAFNAAIETIPLLGIAYKGAFISVEDKIATGRMRTKYNFEDLYQNMLSGFVLGGLSILPEAFDQIESLSSDQKLAQFEKIKAAYSTTNYVHNINFGKNTSCSNAYQRLGVIFENQ